MAPGHAGPERRRFPAPPPEALLGATPAPANGAHRLARALLRRTLPACAVQTPPSAARRAILARLRCSLVVCPARLRHRVPRDGPRPTRGRLDARAEGDANSAPRGEIRVVRRGSGGSPSAQPVGCRRALGRPSPRRLSSRRWCTSSEWRRGTPGQSIARSRRPVRRRRYEGRPRRLGKSGPKATRTARLVGRSGRPLAGGRSSSGGNWAAVSRGPSFRQAPRVVSARGASAVATRSFPSSAVRAARTSAPCDEAHPRGAGTRKDATPRGAPTGRRHAGRLPRCGPRRRRREQRSS